MRAGVFAPCHITGFFEVCWNKDAARAGSRGCGVVMNKGVYTTVRITEGRNLVTLVNGEPCDCPTTRTVLSEVMKSSGREFGVEVYHNLDIPMKYGFGASGAGALGTVLAINRALGLNMTVNQCGEIAHRAEVINKTGLGDVIAELTGGLVIRTEPGAPGIGRTDAIPCEDYVVAVLIGKEMETKSILENPDKISKINTVGKECMELLLKKPTVENFLRLSKEFALKTDLMEEKVYSVVRQLESQGVQSSMAMLGNAVFTITEDPEKVLEKVEEVCIMANIDNEGARIL
jgi:pantoate kinase